MIKKENIYLQSLYRYDETKENRGLSKLTIFIFSTYYHRFIFTLNTKYLYVYLMRSNSKHDKTAYYFAVFVIKLFII